MSVPATAYRLGAVEAVECDPRSAPYRDLVRVLDYWEQARGGRFAPRRTDLDPAALVEALPRIMLAEVLADALGDRLEFRYRLSGTGIADVHGQEMTGKGPRDLTPPAYGAMIHAHYCEAVRRRAPMLHVIVLDTFERSRSYARLLLPLSHDGQAVTTLMAVDSKEQDRPSLKEFFHSIRQRG